MAYRDQPEIKVTKDSENRALLERIDFLSKIDQVPVTDGELHNVVFSIPQGRQLVSAKRFLDEVRTKPERREGTAVAQTIDSFIELTKRFKDGDSAVFADDGEGRAPSLTAVLDYNQAGSDNTKARFGQHRVIYRFPVSDEWKIWGSEIAPMDQREFAEFLEDRIGDVMDPSVAPGSVQGWAEKHGVSLASAARLLELSRGLSVAVDQKVAQHQNLSSGEGVLHFEEVHKDASGNQLRVPGGFGIQIPIFRHGATYALPVRLRYRVRGGVTWTLMTHRADLAFRDAFVEACEKAQEDTQLPLYYGKPE